MATMIEGMAKGLRFLKLISEDTLKANLKTVEEFRQAGERLKIPLKQINEESKETADNFGKAESTIRKFLKSLEENAKISKKQFNDMMNALDSAEKSAEEFGLSLAKIKDNVLEAFKKDFENINNTLGKMAHSGIKAFSRSLAEAVVMGKDLNMSMKQLAQKILVDLLAFTIQIILQESIRFLLAGKIFKEKEKEKNTNREIGILNSIDAGIHLTKLETIKAQNRALRDQQKIQQKNAIMTIASSFLGGFAKGGAVSKGQPVVVGERGAEVFVPNSTGQITQSARGKGSGGVNVNFTINTIDSRGFSDALQENRGTITGIINNALAEKGRSELV
jgi:hypothetical protein